MGESGPPADVNVGRSDNVEAFDEGEESEVIDLDPTAEMWRKVHMGLTAVLSLGGMGTMGAAVVTASATAKVPVAIYVAGGVTAVTAPKMVLNQHNLTKGPTLRGTLNLIRKENNLLVQENSILHDSVDDIEEEVEELKEIEEGLKSIADQQGADVNELVSLVSQNEETLKGMKIVLRKTAIEDITNIVMAADQDGDNIIAGREVRMLILRIQTKLEAHGIDMDAVAFEEMVKKNPCIDEVMKISRVALLGEDAREEMNGLEDVESQRTELANMFSVQDKYNAGSVDKARGNRAQVHSDASVGSTRSKQSRRSTSSSGGGRNSFRLKGRSSISVPTPLNKLPESQSDLTEY